MCGPAPRTAASADDRGRRRRPAWVPADERRRARPGPAPDVARLLAEEVELVLTVVDEVHAVTAGRHREPEQRAVAVVEPRNGGVVQGRDRDLLAERRGLHDVPVEPIHGEDVAAGRDGQAE